MTRLLFPIFLGCGGVAILLWLGFWQLDRLEWKEGILAEIDGRMQAEPVPLPPTPTLTEDADEYMRVVIAGRPTGAELHVLASGTAAGTGYRVIAAFETMEGRTIMVDRGLLPVADKALPPTLDQTTITGTLLWPDDMTSGTAGPDIVENIWFARDVEPMARRLETDPIMVIEAEATVPDPRLTQLPVSTAGIKNDHLEYAITWFLLALVWAAMTLYLIRRTLLPPASKD